MRLIGNTRIPCVLETKALWEIGLAPVGTHRDAVT
jgi:hypothetical protein